MVLFSEERFEQDFQFDRLKQTIHTVMQSAVITPKSFYYFIQRYSYFNRYASAVIAGLKAHDNTYRALDQILLQTVGDYARLSGPERHRIAQVPTWLREITQSLVNQYPGTPGDIASLVRALGFHAASEMVGEPAVLDRLLRYDCPWNHLIQSQAGREEHCQQALNTLNLILDYRIELPEQIKAWVYEGYQSFIDVQQRLFHEIYRESLELQYCDRDFVRLPVQISVNRPIPTRPCRAPFAAATKSPPPSCQRTPSSPSSVHIPVE